MVVYVDRLMIQVCAAVYFTLRRILLRLTYVDYGLLVLASLAGLHVCVFIQLI